MNVNKICNFSLGTSLGLQHIFTLCNLLMESLVINLLFHLSVPVIFGIYVMKDNENFKNN